MEGAVSMSKELLVASVGLAFFIVCPRMAGMVHIIAKHSQVSLMTAAFLGTCISVPLVLCMVALFGSFGVGGALLFCVLTDLGAAFFMKDISYRAGVETLVVALFVLVGVKVAPLISGLLFR